MRELYPEIEPVNTFHLDTGSVHSIYVEEAGNRAGIPVVFLHGGPGSGCNPNHRRYFDPERYHIIIFDQRGCNRSTPQGEVQENTTALILQDMESIRHHLNIDKWLLFGGSWGATLALLYAETHPDRVSGMVLRGAFLARQRDLDWFIRDGVNRFLPDEWIKLVEVVPEDKRQDLIAAFHEIMHGSDDPDRQKAARAWSSWCTRVVTWNLTAVQDTPSGENDSAAETRDNDQKTINEVRIETHYALNRYFIRENQILDDIGKLPEVPVHLVHGRQDITCLPQASWQLHQEIPASTLEILSGTGHLAGENAMINALVRATDKMAGKLA